MRDTAATTATQKYSLPAISLHWLMAFLIIWGFSLGWILSELPHLLPDKGKYMAWHKWIGVTVFALALLRLLVRLAHRPPPLPRKMACWEYAVLHSVHALLYLLMFAVPLSGYLYSASAGRQVVYLGLVPLPMLIEPSATLKPILKTTHIFLNYALLGLFVLHLLAALKHQFINRDGLLARMVPFLKSSKSGAQDTSDV